ncbi:MAG TPA: amino acid permease [Ginsengibacter sp.]|nr:amino acid permease [Ginsengibacter sp.]
MQRNTERKPARFLGLFDVSALMVSFVLGMGIFRTPVNVAAAIDSPLIYFLSWIAGGVVAFCGALTYAEIGSRLPVTGGYYKVFSYAYHPSIAFGINCIILVSNAATLGAVALVGGEYQQCDMATRKSIRAEELSDCHCTYFYHPFLRRESIRA